MKLDIVAGGLLLNIWLGDINGKGCMPMWINGSRLVKYAKDEQGIEWRNRYIQLGLQLCGRKLELTWCICLSWMELVLLYLHGMI